MKEVNGISLPVDFLVENPPATQGTLGTLPVNEIWANILPGIDRALKSAREVTVSGTDLAGATQNLTIRLCEAGPFLALKLRAFAHRQAPKDAFDILYTMRHYDRGTSAACAAFAEEVRMENPACADAVTRLQQYFQDEQSSAPVRSSNFVLGEPVPGESESIRQQRIQIRQDTVDAGRLLLDATEGLRESYDDTKE